MGHERKAQERHTFGEFVEGVTPADLSRGGFEAFYSPIDAGEFTDEHGVRWRLRGGELRWSRIQRLLLDRQVPVVHVYSGEVREIADGDRADFLAVIRPYLRGPHVPTPGDHADYAAAEFKDGQHRSLLVVEETC